MKDLVLVAIVVIRVKTVLTTASAGDSRSRAFRMSDSMVNSKLLVGRHHERISYAGRGDLVLVAAEAENVLLAIEDQNCGLNFRCIEDLLPATLDFKLP
ncbi:hypothetical protein FB45DRAFT_945710 [Roridomyces roridus]|uniref:Uncharacterized protein n=1 Tax=Roridomyces roridus TaxID=1738132 RepID=A0AAD7B371_9AGAR|nr:hypothetical protein FB45DRAFT_945710 [Roridomyces roridus]